MIPFVVVAFAWLFQSLTGFGAGIFIIGVLSIFYDPKMVIVSSAVFNLLGTLSLLYQNRRGKVEWRMLLYLVGGSAPGILLGAYLLDKINAKELKIVIGLFILALGLYDLLVQKGYLKLRLGIRAGLFAGFLGGFFAGLVGMGGPPPVVYLNQHLSDPCSIRLMLNLYFTSNILLRWSFYTGFDVVPLDWSFILSGVAGIIVGTTTGSLLARRLPSELYRVSVPYAVMFLGAVLLFLAERGL